MPQSKISRFWHLKLFSSLAISGVLTLSASRACAQVTPDATLGAERSVVRSEVSNGSPRQQIDGGATRGTNLFHSFRSFNVGEGQSVYFRNPAGIENIIGRVTGRNRSNIQGTLGVLGGNANLFLLNPNGFIFGPNARLDIKGSFVATSANAIQFGNQGFFSSSAPGSPPLLTVNPSAFLFNQVAHGSIINRSIAPSATSVGGLQVGDGRSLLLLGGNVSLEGGMVNAPEGRVEIGGVTGPGTVGLSVDGSDLHLSFPDNVARADISLTAGAVVDASGEGGGAIQVQGRRVSVSGGSKLEALTLGAEPGEDVTVNASEVVELFGFSRRGTLTTQARGTGRGGDITIRTRRLVVRGGAQVSTGTISEGDAGRLTVNASESVEVVGTDGEDVNSGLIANTAAAGDAGSLEINTRRLIVRDDGLISSSATLFPGPNGEAIPATGQGGNITINASESVELGDGQIGTETLGPGDAGNLTINTSRLLVESGSFISTQATSGDEFEGYIPDLSKLTGNAGDLTINASSLLIQTGGTIAANSETLGRAGNIAIDVRDTLQANNGRIATLANRSSGGAINIRAGAIRLEGNSNITTSVLRGAGGGGDLTLKAPSIFAFGDSDILAYSRDGRGGNITLDTLAFFGQNYTPAPLNIDPETLNDNGRVDINAQGRLGSGVVNLPEVNPLQGLLGLSAELTDVSNQIAQNCRADVIAGTSQFLITGHGGLPPDSSEMLSREAVLADLGVPAQPGAQQASISAPAPTLNASTPQRLVEAQGWVKNAEGEIMLVAQPPTTTLQASRQATNTCSSP
ncbi:filamentous hemagglutinin N-terminal domain-containing protein [Leptolyngbya sp. FACHB-261]|uniref:two-partner secretion domain-containing protein n=1 Tax=Leptolyngbya sp. FACHB-261 TaxID=2692806 RepID=UPI0016823347|nr:filamentous hemagglutinin N-terminal domain-containing protein [Leptolyngbya sp. FACHB-261]MBD2103047.1 filamentous hemagglutinin N-terminal domain-containing protein [Leptolyngbya sp. FACHB-261]